jgi:general secretion pathway protein K
MRSLRDQIGSGLPHPRAAGSCAGQRGAALLVAIASIAILTAVSVDLAYNTRVSLQMAANARDELRATYLAKSAVSMSRLVLYFQQRLDRTTGSIPANLMGALSGKGGLTDTASSPATGAKQQGGAAGGAGISLRLWDLVPIDSSAAALFLGGGMGGGTAAAPAPIAPPPAAPDGGAPQQGTRRIFGDTEGSFHATIEDEDRKINLRQFDAIGAFPAAQGMRLAQLVKDPKWDFLFDEDDANGFRVSRKDLFGAIKDWEDLDETSSNFTGDPLKPFEPGFGDENYLYDRAPQRYKAKNASFDSLDELFMVGGVSDAFMAAFGDKLTVYPDVNTTINVNTDDPLQLMVNTLVMADPPGKPQPAMLDPAFISKLATALKLVRPLPFMSIGPQQFATMLQALGVKVQAIYARAAADPGKNPFGDRSSTFHIHAVGAAGDVQKTIDAVVTFDQRAEGLAQDQGRLLHWHEE